MIARESNVGQRMMFALVYELRELGSVGSELIRCLVLAFAGEDLFLIFSVLKSSIYR